MAIAIDVRPNINSAAFAQSVKMGMAEGLLMTVHDILPEGHARQLVIAAIEEIRALSEESDG